MPIYNSPLDMLAAFVIVYAISALSTMALAWFIKRTARKAASRPSGCSGSLRWPIGRLSSVYKSASSNPIAAASWRVRA